MNSEFGPRHVCLSETEEGKTARNSAYQYNPFLLFSSMPLMHEAQVLCSLLRPKQQ